MLEGVQYNTHCDWLMHVVGAIFPYYMCYMCTWWSAVLLLLCARMPCAPVFEYEPPCLIKPCCVVLVWLIQFCKTQQHACPWVCTSDKQIMLPLAILFLTCSGLYLERMALNHTCTARNRLWAFPPLRSPLCVMWKKNLKKEWPHKTLGLKSTWKEFPGFHMAVFFSRFFTVTLSDIQY